MGNSVETLSILAEVSIAFVAFSAIVASIKLSIGGSLTPYKKLLIHYFTESSMLSLSIALITLVLLDFFPGRQEFVAGFPLTYTFVTTAICLTWYLYRRFQINAPTPLGSKLIMIGFIIMIILLGISVTGFFWQPSIQIMSAVCLWAFINSSVIFSSFLATFIDVGNEVSITG